VAKPPERLAEQSPEKKAVKPVDKTPDKQPVVKKIDKPAEKPEVKKAEKPTPKPVEKAVEKPAEKPVTKAVEKPVEKPVSRPLDKAVDDASKPAADKPGEKPVDEGAKPAADESARPASAAPPAGKTAAAVPAPAPAKPGGQHVILIGAFANPENVKQLQGKIGGLGVSTYTEMLNSPDGAKTRVRAGPFPTREAADNALEKLKRSGINGVVAGRQ